MFENRALRRVTEGCGILDNEDLHDLKSSANIIKKLR
jgi:hypothetical protein